MDNKKVEKARNLAVLAHKGQTRKGSDTSYMTHPERVYEIVKTVTNDADILASCYLHDVVEDTSYRIEDIKNLIGPKVASYVAEMTEQKQIGNTKIPWGIRKEKALKKIKDLSEGARLIKIADKISNAEDLRTLFQKKGRITFEDFKEKSIEKQEWYYFRYYEELKKYTPAKYQFLIEQLKGTIELSFNKKYEEYRKEQELIKKTKEMKQKIEQQSKKSPILIEIYGTSDSQKENVMTNVTNFLKQQSLIAEVQNQEETRFAQKSPADVILISGSYMQKKLDTLEAYYRQNINVYQTIDKLAEYDTSQSQNFDGLLGLASKEDDENYRKAFKSNYLKTTPLPHRQIEEGPLPLLAIDFILETIEYSMTKKELHVKIKK